VVKKTERNRKSLKEIKEYQKSFEPKKEVKEQKAKLFKKGA